MCYDLERFIDQKVASAFICTICTGVLCCPQKVKNSPQSKQEVTELFDGHCFCESCILNALKYSKHCPECRRYMEFRQLAPLNRVLLNLLKSLKIRCIYYNKGCQHILDLEEIEIHEVNCMHRFNNAESCSKSTKCIKCDAPILRGIEHSEVSCLTNTFEQLLHEKDEKLVSLKDENKRLNENVQELNNIIQNLGQQKPHEQCKKSLNVGNCMEFQLLELCKSGGYFGQIKKLIEEKVNVNCKDWLNSTPLHWASSNGHFEIAKLLLENGAKVDEQNDPGYTPIICAAWNGHLEIVELLHKNGAYVSAQTQNGSTALMEASANGHYKIAKYLIKNGAFINAKDVYGETASKKAKTSKIKRYLISKGAI